MGRPIEAAHKIAQRGQIRTDGLSTILFEPDIRSFQDILFAWEKHEQSSGQSFLDKTGLSRVINAEQWRQIELGEKIPSARLARVMAMHLPGGILRPDEPATFYPQLYGFRSRADRWRKNNSAKPEIDVTDEHFNRFCVNALEDLRKTNRAASTEPVAPDDSPLPAGPDMREKILGYLVNKGGGRKTAEEIEEILAAQYADSPGGTVRGCRGC